MTTGRNEADLSALFLQAARRAADYRINSPKARTSPRLKGRDAEALLASPLPETREDPAAVIDALANAAEPGLLNITSPRFFGWVMGASHPAGVAADFLTSAWGQNCAMSNATPAAVYAEKTVSRWILDLLDLPRDSSVGLVSGATMANFVGLAAARSKLYRDLGWDVEEDGMIGAPPIRVLIGEDAHASVYAALQYLGLGRRVVTPIATDACGRMIATALEAVLSQSDAPAIVIAQAGQINTGAIDPFEEIVPVCRAHKAWLHVDGAFGLWARACKDRASLAAGIDGADSWATDGHKWLQLPYDCGFAIVRDAEAHRRAMSISASYIVPDEADYNPKDLVPELSRRAKGFAAWAVIKTLGREGIDEMISRHCRLARLAANRLRKQSGIRVLNAVTLNQIIVDFDIEATTRHQAVRDIVNHIKDENRVFVETADWHGRTIIRISIISCDTQAADIDALVEAISDAWKASPFHPDAAGDNKISARVLAITSAGGSAA